MSNICVRHALASLCLSRSSLKLAPLSRLSSSASSTLQSQVDLASADNGDLIQLSVPWSALAADGVHAQDLVVLPGYLSQRQQDVLLAAALAKLDSGEGREERKHRRDYIKRNGLKANAGTHQGKLPTRIAHRYKKAYMTYTSFPGFLPDKAYLFHERHFDGVISGYRETTLSAWPAAAEESKQDLEDAVKLIYALLPQGKAFSQSDTDRDALTSPPHLITHILHLAANGYILPHVDNIQASAGTIAGVSLGRERHLLLHRNSQRQSPVTQRDEIRVTLPPGSAYIQRGKIRYEWAHAIPKLDGYDESGRDQRLSVMVRDRHPASDRM